MRAGWVVVATVAGCVGPYPDPSPKKCTAPDAQADVLAQFEDQYCQQLADCLPDDPCTPPDLAGATGCTLDDQAAHDCLCGDWACDAGGVIYPAACNFVCG
jgi:hypothetical protein